MPRLTILATLALLTAPVGAATWFVNGNYEPDTKFDVDGKFVPQDADTSLEGLTIYFNGYATSSQSGVNPNSDVAGSRIATAGQAYYRAYLGIWKDCNDDGYIGNANSALHTYPANLEDVTAICPDGSMFNKGGWVYEFIWIGRGGHRAGDANYPSEDDQRWVNDTDAKVWLDFGAPGDAPRGTCPLRPLPPGTFASTGGLLRVSDCVTGRRIAGAVNGVDSDGSLGLKFDDPREPQTSDSLLNQRLVNLFGNPYGGDNYDTWETGLLEKNSQKGRQASYDPSKDYDPDNTDKAFHVWDCSDPNRHKVENPTGNDDVTAEDPTGGEIEEDGTIEVIQLSRNGVIVSAPNPAPGIDNARGSYYDGLNDTERGGANVWFGGNVGGNGSENCNTDNATLSAAAYSPGLVESSSNVPSAALKRQSNDVFSFNLGGGPPRGNIILSDAGQRTVRENTTAVQEGGIDPDIGAAVNATIGPGYQYNVDFRGPLILRPGWDARTVWTNTENTVRGDGSAQSASYVTFYASVGATTFGLKAKTNNNNVPGIYGHEWCDGATSGASAKIPGWDCDKSHWWKPQFGADSMPLSNNIELGAFVGDNYHLRDVDCKDGTLVRGFGLVYASFVALSEGGPCVDAAV